MEKKTFLERYKEWKAKVDSWAADHTVLGFPVRHPSIFLIICFTVVLVVCGSLNAAARKRAAADEVPNTSVVVPQPRIQKANASDVKVLEHYSYFIGGSYQLATGSASFDYDKQVFTCNGRLIDGDYVTEIRVPLSSLSLNAFDSPVSWFVNPCWIVSDYESFSFGYDDGDTVTYYGNNFSSVWLMPTSMTIGYDDYIMLKVVDEDPVTSLYVDIVGTDRSVSVLPTQSNVLNSTWYNSYEPFRMYANASYNDSYKTGYDAGYDEGYGSGYSIGKEYGYNLGQNSDLTLTTLFWNVIDEPFAIIYRLLNFDVLGVNIFTFCMGIVTLGIVGFVIKLII